MIIFATDKASALRSIWHISFALVFLAAMAVGCGKGGNPVVDHLNEQSYYYHSRNLDSTRVFADSALALAGDYDGGRAEALNNLAFVDMAAMRYGKASQRLAEVEATTDNQIELLVADIQQMRLCQKRSQNKDFYVYSDRARSRLRRILSEEARLNDHEQQRLTYAETEYYIVASTYYYYVGLTRQSIAMMDSIDVYGPVQRDTAQLLNYWYNIGAGGILEGPKEATAQKEFEYLAKCYYVSSRYGYPYWEAQALQAMSEHLQDPAQRRTIIANNYPTILSVNTDNMPDSLLAGNLAERSLGLFSRYGDVYQTAGANRTLAECYWHIGDNRSALICLNRALATITPRSKHQTPNSLAPDLVASIREDLCLVYSAVDDKRNSDINRNIYLDIQEQTRQDRLLEARASQLKDSSRELNIMIGVVMLMIAAVCAMLVFLARLRKRSDGQFSLSTLLQPLKRWQQHNDDINSRKKEEYQLIGERMDVAKLHLSQNKQRNLEQRAKVQLVVSILPLIDRMRNEVRRLARAGDRQQEAETDRRKQALQYVTELCDSINDYNNILTNWIQMRQGELSLKIESFPLQQLFDIVSHSSMGFTMKGITLTVRPTDCVVKADRTLTLFMINTIADNARKFTPKGGTVTISASIVDNAKGDNAAKATGPTPQTCVEVSIADDGPGMTEETRAHIFDRTYTGGHGFGLKNCKGIIEKYKKISRIFSPCEIGSESKTATAEGGPHGTRIFFRLPSGRMRTLIATIMLAATTGLSQAANPTAAAFADSAYLSNVMGDYNKTLRYADSCRKHLTPRDTAIILDISNEAAVAALALHKWDLYRQNNQLYTRLFREASADSSLPAYVRTMQRSKTNKTVAVVLLVMMLIIIFPAYYFLYYRHKLNYRFCIERINGMNDLLLSDMPDVKKLQGIRELKDFGRYYLTSEQRDSLNKVVEQIETALSSSIDNKAAIETQTELAQDECRRIELENDRLHVSNSVLDNCLSTLKHETMYYPSRIRQMIDRQDCDIDAVSEVVDYYHDLYAILAEQAVRQVLPQRIDKDTVAYMFEILKRLSPPTTADGSETPSQPAAPSVSDAGNGYVSVTVPMPGLKVTDAQLRDLFTPDTVNLDFLLVRQIVREMGDATNLRACGVSAERNDKGDVQIKILMPKRYERL